MSLIKQQNNKLKLLLICVFISVASFVLILSLIPNNLATTPDSISYLDAAQNISAGHGFVLTNFVYGSEEKYTSLTVWPPLYSIFISLIPSIDNNSLFASMQAAIVILSLNSMLFFFILRKIMNDGLSLLAVAVFMISSANLIISSYVWSESLFLTMLLASALFSINSYEASKESNMRDLHFNLILLAIALSGIFYTRYIGLVFGFIIPLTWMYSPYKKKIVPAYLWSCFLYAAISGGLLFRNYIIGDITGGDVRDTARQASTLSLTDNLWAVIDSMALLIPGNINLLLIIISLSLVVTIGIKYKGVLITTPTTSVNNTQFHLILFSSIVIIYLGALIVIRSITNFEDIRIRYIAVVSPFIIMLVVIGVSKFKQSNLKSWMGVLRLGTSTALIVMFVIQGITVFNDSKLNRQKYGDPRMPLTRSDENAFYSDLTSPFRVAQIYQLIETIGAKKDDLILVERPKVWAFISGMKFRRLKGGVNQHSLEWLNQQKEKGFLLLLEKKSKLEAKKYYSFKEELISLPFIAVVLP